MFYPETDADTKKAKPTTITLSLFEYNIDKTTPFNVYDLSNEDSMTSFDVHDPSNLNEDSD